MRDLDVRRVLDSELRRAHERDSATRIVHELGVCNGAKRVDVAVVNGSLTGFEIKAAADRLDRLPSQASSYSQVFDRLTLVVAERHLAGADALVPAWWGIQMAAQTAPGAQITLEAVREPEPNPGLDPVTLASLLWRDEALATLERRGLVDGFRSKPRKLLWQRLADELPLTELAAEVRAAIKSRDGWRSE